MTRNWTLALAAVFVASFCGLGTGSADAVKTRRAGHWASLLAAGTAQPAHTKQQGKPDPLAPPWAAPTVAVGGNPVGVDVDPATHTLYVANTNDDTISLADVRHCNAQSAARCTAIAALTVGPNPLYVVVDSATHTVYVSLLGGNTIEVVDGATCSALDTSGCGQTPSQITVAGTAAGLTLDAATHTMYVGEANDGQTSVVDTATCNAIVTSGCGQTPVQTAALGDTLALDPATHSVYASDFIHGAVNVFDAATCNATVSSGCGTVVTSVPIDGAPTQPVVAAHTLYLPVVGTDDVGAVAMLDTETCNATTTAGCATRSTKAGNASVDAIADPSTGTVYILNGNSDTLAVLDSGVCNAESTVGCPQVPPAIAVGHGPGLVVLDPSTHTLYATSQDTNSVWVLDAAACNALKSQGCTPFAPATAVGGGAEGVALNPATKTVYVANWNDGDVSVIDASACNIRHLSGCGQSWPTIPVGSNPFGVAIDRATNTIYVTNFGSNTVSVIDGSTCNADVHTGCSQTPVQVAVGAGPERLAVDQATNTVYVPNLLENTVSVIDSSTCNAQTSAGCSQTLPTMHVSGTSHPIAVAVNDKTHTVYTSNANPRSVSVFDGATCNGTVTTGCGQTPATVPVGHGPNTVAVDESTNTIYVPALVEGYISVIDGSVCDAENTSGCGQTAPTVDVGGQPWVVALDSANHTLYVSSITDSDVNELNTASCYRGHTQSCHAAVIPFRMGGTTGAFALDDSSGTGYVASFDDNEVSLFDLKGS
jgi:YVTN family beta-propeller protein